MIVRPSVSKMEKAKSRKLCSEIASCAAFLRVMAPDSSPSSAFTVVRKDSARSHSVRRTRTELSIAAVPGTVGFASSSLIAGKEHVTRAAPCMKQRLRGTRVNFSANPVHVHLNKIRKRVEFFIPNMFRDFRPAHHAAGVAREEFNQSIL